MRVSRAGLLASLMSPLTWTVEFVQGKGAAYQMGPFDVVVGLVVWYIIGTLAAALWWAWQGWSRKQAQR